MPRVLFEDFKRISKMAEIDFIKYGLFCGKDWNYKNLKDPYNRLYIVLEGEGMVVANGITVQLKAGNAYLIPRDMAFETKTIIGMKKLFIHFKMASYFHFNMMNGLGKVLETKIDTDLYQQYADRLEEQGIQDYLKINSAFKGLIYDLISQLDIRTYEDQIKDIPVVLHELHRLLQVDLTGKTRIGSLADALGTSQSMLSKVFKTTTGITLKHFMKRELMTRAQIQLTSTNRSIQEIAYELEYDDPLYFSRLFHQWTGMSPTAYRKLNKTIYI